MNFRKPKFMYEAMKGKDRSPFVYVLIPVVLYLIGDLIGGIVKVPFMIAFLMNDSEASSLIKSGSTDMNKLMPIAKRLVEDPPAYISASNLIGFVGLIIASIVYIVKFDKRNIKTVGYGDKKIIVNFFIGIFYGVGIFCLYYFISLYVGNIDIQYVNENMSLLDLNLIMIGIFIQSIAFEFLFKGVFLVSYSKKNSMFSSVILSSILESFYYIYTFGISSILGFFCIFILSFFSCMIYLNRESIIAPIAFWYAIGAVQGPIFGLGVRGVKPGFGIVGSAVNAKDNFASLFISDAQAPEVSVFLVFIVISVSVFLAVYMVHSDQILSRDGRKYTDLKKDMEKYKNATPADLQRYINEMESKRKDNTVTKNPTPKEFLNAIEKLEETGVKENEDLTKNPEKTIYDKSYFD